MPLKQWDIKINYGIKTGLNEVFGINSDLRKDIIKGDAKSTTLIKKYLRGRDLRRYTPIYSEQWLIFTRKGTDIKKYPSIERYLKPHYEVLKPKKNGDKTGRKPGPYAWFEIQDNVAYHKDFTKPKIIYPVMSKHQPFVYDAKGEYYSNDKTFILTGDALPFLTAFCNSRLFRFCFLDRFPDLGEDRREMRKVFFEKIPVKKPTLAEQKPFEKLVTKILDAKAADVTADTSALERDIDQLVYALYGLKAEEIALVEGKMSIA